MHRVALSARLCRQAAVTAAARRVGVPPAAALRAGVLQQLQLLRQRPRQARGYTATRVTAVAAPFSKPLPAAPAWAPSAVPGTAAPGGLQRLWQAYLTSLARRPLMTKAATSFLCVVIGDSIAQALGGAPYSILRVLRLAAYSSTVGATTGHYWHRWLEQHVEPQSPTSGTAVTKKLLLDQLLLSPVMTAVFFVALKTMEGRPDAIVPFLQEKYLPTVMAATTVWVPWNIISFRFIPQDLRILAGNLVGIGWGTWMSVSCINSQSPAAMPTACPAAAAALQRQAE